MLIQGKLLSYEDNLSEVLEIRQKVFIEEQGYAESSVFDELDQMCMHVIVYEENPNWNKKEEDHSKKAVASGRIIFDGLSCEIGNIAVLKEYRGKKYGDFTVRMLLNKAFTAGINTVTLKTPCDISGFFETIGFQILGDCFTERNINYYTMIIKSSDVITQCSHGK